MFGLRHVLVTCLSIALAPACTDLGDDKPFIILPDADVIEPTLDDLTNRVFRPRCGCHTGTMPAGGMDLSDGAIFASLVSTPSTCNGTFRVDPGNPTGSLLVGKLAARTENRASPCGDGMPLSGAPLSAAELEAIRQWIRDGAVE